MESEYTCSDVTSLSLVSICHSFFELETGENKNLLTNDDEEAPLLLFSATENLFPVEEVLFCKDLWEDP